MFLRHSEDLDLGKDPGRVRPEDKRRQVATVNALLASFTGPKNQRRELQVLADEVGLGKTFVALATAYSILKGITQRDPSLDQEDIYKGYRAVLVIVPSQTLAKKWEREVEAIRTRCSVNPAATDWFTGKACVSATDLYEFLVKASDRRRKPGENPCVLICTGNIFTKRMVDQEPRLRFMAACLFRWLGNRLSKHERHRVVTRASEVPGYEEWSQFSRRVGKGHYQVDLWDFDEHEKYLADKDPSNLERSAEKAYQSVSIRFKDVSKALDRIESLESGIRLLSSRSVRIRGGYEEPLGLLPYCKFVAEKRGKPNWFFDGFKDRLNDVYKEVIQQLIDNVIPLVIVDEAHHWRNEERNDRKKFANELAPLTRRLLLLTATPFQLHRDELIRVLSIYRDLEEAIGPDRAENLQKMVKAVEKASVESETCGLAFQKAWGRLGVEFARIDPNLSPALEIELGLEDPRKKLILEAWRRIKSKEGATESVDFLDREVPLPLRDFFQRAVELESANIQLGAALGKLMIRHRRETCHRRFLIGKEYPKERVGIFRPDQSRLYQAPGAITPADTELSQYVMMRLVAEQAGNKRRTTLGMDLTGCYTTLWSSSEGKRALEAEDANAGQKLFKLLKKLTGYKGKELDQADERHPKMRLVVEEVIRRWETGEKSLIFCQRVPTAETLHRLLERRIKDRLRSAKKALVKSFGLEGDSDADVERAMRNFRESLSSRESRGIALFMDRVLLGWLGIKGIPVPEFKEDERRKLAGLYQRAYTNRKPLFKKGGSSTYDRVFLNRAVEYILASKILANPSLFERIDDQDQTRELMEMISSEDWIQYRYGQPSLTSTYGSEKTSEETTDSAANSTFARGYELSDLEYEPGDPAVNKLSELFSGNNTRNVVDSILSGPNLFVPLALPNTEFNNLVAKRSSELAKSLFDLNKGQGEGYWDPAGWDARGKAVNALARSILREDILLRMPRETFKDVDGNRTEKLLHGFHRPISRHQKESLAERVELFLQELAGLSPKEREPFFNHAMNPNAAAVSLVTGSSSHTEARDSIFTGFNSPLLPDILVCTAVGQEGIDLHRHCRHVVHYDLGWNPAILEQRTGRTDRLGSKAIRERNSEIRAQWETENQIDESSLPGLDIAIPYLAATYDERVFNRLRTRAQVFEILTGGDPSADQDAEVNWVEPNDDVVNSNAGFVPLPEELLESLRVRLDISPSI